MPHSKEGDDLSTINMGDDRLHACWETSCIFRREDGKRDTVQCGSQLGTHQMSQPGRHVRVGWVQETKTDIGTRPVESVFLTE